MVRVLVVESQNLCTKPGIPHMPVNPDRMGTEAGGSLKFAGFQTSKKTLEPGSGRAPASEK